LLKSAIIALLICFSIEILQLYQANWMIEIRKTTFGHYILGQGIDLIRYYTENICQNNPELIIQDFFKGLRQ